MIHVVATIEIAAGRRDDFLTIFKTNVPNVLAEAGCLEYGATIDRQTDIAAQPAVRADVVTVVEKWESLDALQAHLVAPHMTTYREQVKDMVLGATLHILEPA